MSTSITFNGTSYTVPALADASWGTNVSNYLIAISTGCLQKTGGSFTLSTADVDFGGTYGLKALYFKSKTANIASSGVIILANADAIAWRNVANSGDLTLGINGSNALIFNSIVLADVSSSQTLTNKIFSDSTCKFGNVSDTTKTLLFSLGGATTGKAMTIASSHTNNRTVTIPDATDTIQLLALAQSPTNKTFDSTSTMTGVKIASFTPDGTHTLTCPTSTDTLVGKATTDTLTNKTLSGNTAVNLVSGSGTLTLNTSGTVTLPNATDTLMGKATTDTMTNKTATAMAVTGGSYINFLAQAATRFNDSSTNYVALQAPSSVTTYTLNLPAAQGGASTTLSNDGSGNLTWVSSLTNALNQFNTFIGNSSNIATAANTNLLGENKASISSATVTITIASPGVVSLTSHGFSTGDIIYLTTTGALPTGLSASTSYYVINVASGTFELATTLANALAGTAINTSGSQSGTHTCFSGGIQSKATALMRTPSFTLPVFADTTDLSKQVKWSISGATTATALTLAAAQTAARTITFPDATTTLVGTDVAQTLTGPKTLTAPIIAKTVTTAFQVDGSATAGGVDFQITNSEGSGIITVDDDGHSNVGILYFRPSSVGTSVAAIKAGSSSKGQLNLGAAGITTDNVNGTVWINESNAFIGMENTASTGTVTMVQFFNGGATTCGSISTDLAGHTTAYNTSSDAKLKTAIADFNGLDLINRMHPCEYERKSVPGIKEYGFIAQELYTVLPQAVTPGSDNKNCPTNGPCCPENGSGRDMPWQVDYSKITGVLCKAIQELKKEIDDLKSKMKG